MLDRFRGRLHRNDYWRRKMAYRLASGFLIASLVGVLVIASRAFDVPLALDLVLMLAGVGGVAALNLSLDVRRLHDLGASGWWFAALYALNAAGLGLFLLGFPTRAPIVSACGVLLFAPSAFVGFLLTWRVGPSLPNRYGPPPPADTWRAPPIAEPSAIRDLDAELRTAQRDLDLAKRRLTLKRGLTDM